MQGYPTIVRTGSQELDVQTVEQHRRAAAAQGITLFVQPLPGGGFQLSATSAQDAGPGATLPSNQRNLLPQQMAPAPAPAAQAQSPHLDPSGTMPSHLASFAPARASQTPQVELILRPGEGYCEACHRVGPVRRVTFMQNIGVVVIRFPRTVSGQLCKFCIDKYFFRFTGVTMVLGWWGVISFFSSLIAVPMNVVHWVGSFGMATPTEDIDAFRERRGRGSVGIAIGVVVLLMALMSLGLGAVLATTEDGRGVVPLAVMGGFLGLIAVVVLFFGVRARVRASAGLRRLGAR